MVRERLCRLVRKGGLSEGVGGLCYTNLKMGQGTRRIVATDCDEPLELTLRRWGDPLLKVLLADRTLSRPIRWATDGISALGRGFGRWDAMTPARVRQAVAAGVLRLRAAKSLEERQARVRAHGEVFTPAWICRVVPRGRGGRAGDGLPAPRGPGLAGLRQPPPAGDHLRRGALPHGALRRGHRRAHPLGATPRFSGPQVARFAAHA